MEQLEDPYGQLELSWVQLSEPDVSTHIPMLKVLFLFDVKVRFSVRSMSVPFAHLDGLTESMDNDTP